MKKVTLLIVGLLLLGAIPATVFLVGQRQELRKKAAPATTLSLTPATITKQVGDTFTVEVAIDTAENQVVAAELHIVFDPAILEATTIANGPLFPNVLASGVVERGTATITVGAVNAAQPVKGAGTAATIRFKALAATTAPVSVRFASNTFVGSLGEGAVNVLVGSTPASVTITGDGTIADGATPTATPSATLTPTLTPTLAASGSSEASASALKILSPTKDSSTSDATPLIQGKAPAGTRVTITIYSTPQTVVVTADGNGNWSYTPATELEPGPHSIVATSQNPTTGTTQTTNTSFVVAAAGESSASESAIPIAGNINLTLILVSLGILLFTTGILVPVVF